MRDQRDFDSVRLKLKIEVAEGYRMGCSGYCKRERPGEHQPTNEPFHNRQYNLKDSVLRHGERGTGEEILKLDESCISNPKSPIGLAILRAQAFNLRFRISDLRCRIRPISKFSPADPRRASAGLFDNAGGLDVVQFGKIPVEIGVALPFDAV